MITTAILNAVLAFGVIVMVVTPLAWAIRTQHSDHPQPVAIDAAGTRALHPQPRRRASRSSYQLLAGRS